MPALFGSLVADLSANSAAFKRDMSDASRAVRSNTTRMNRFLGQLDRGFASARRNARRMAVGFGAIVTAGAAAATGVALVGRRALEHADDLIKQADAVGLLVDQYTALRFQASQEGVGDELEPSMTRFIRNIGELKAETGSLMTFLDRYDEGLARRLVATRSQAEALDVLADAIRNEEDATLRAALASAAFGRRGARMVRMFSSGAEGIDNYRARAEELNIVLGEDLARSAEAANDEIDALTRQIQMQWTVAVAENAEEVRALTAAFSDALPVILSWARAFGHAMGLGVETPRTFSGLREQATEVDDLIDRYEALDAALRISRSRQDFINRANQGEFSRLPRPDRLRDVLGDEAANDVMAASGFTHRGYLPRGDEFDLFSVNPVLHALRARRDEIVEAQAALRAALREDGGGSNDDLELDLDLDTSDAEARAGDAVAFMLDVAEQMNEARAAIAGEAEAYFDATRTASERYAAELERVALLEQAGAFADHGGFETAARARTAALLDMAQATGDLNGALYELQRLSDAGLINIANLAVGREQLLALADTRENVVSLFDDIREAATGVFGDAQNELVDYVRGLSDLDDAVAATVDSIIAHFARMASQRLIFDPLDNLFSSALTRLFGRPSSSGDAVSFFMNALPGFRNGADFMVGGAGGVDSQVVAFRASPNERVTVSPPGFDRAASVSSNVVNFEAHSHVHVSPGAGEGIDKAALRRAQDENNARLLATVRASFPAWLTQYEKDTA